MLSRLARPVFLMPLVVVLVLIGVGAWLWARAGSSTPVSDQQAREQYGGGTSGEVIPGGPRVGVWAYRATGDETVGVGPIEVDRELPGTARMVVRPAPGGYWRTLALSEEHVEASRLRLAPGGEQLVERVTTVKVTGIGRDDRQVLVPPPVVYPRDLAPGDAWTERYRMDKVQVLTRARALRRATVTVGSTEVPTVVIDKRTKIWGPIEGYRRDVIWWSDELKMPVRWVLSTGVDGVASLRTDADVTMTSTVPRA